MRKHVAFFLCLLPPALCPAQEAAPKTPLRDLAAAIHRAFPQEAVRGKVAKADKGNSYATLGRKHGLSKGQKLLVFRGAEPIVDPDTKEVLGTERLKIGEVTITDAQDAYCKVEPDANLVLTIGDQVEPVIPINAIAILPAMGESGANAPAGKSLEDVITHSLTEARVRLVERRLIEHVFFEIDRQTAERTVVPNQPRFDVEMIRRLGKQLGATAVIAASINNDSRWYFANSTAPVVFLRVIKTETGEIVHTQRFEYGKNLFKR